MTRQWLQSLLVATTFVLTACGGGGSSSDSTGSQPAGTVTGTVIANTDSQPIANASLQFGNAKATTDANGSFSLSVPAGAGQVLEITAPGYAAHIVRVSVTANGTAGLQAALTPIGTSATLSIANGGDVTLAGSTAQVTLPANGLVDDATKQTVSGNATVNLTAIDPGINPSAMPGGYMASTANGTTQAMESFGAIQVDLRSSTGRKLQLAEGKTATIRIPVSASVVNPPATIPLFFLDETTGLWKAEGSANLVGAGANAYYEGTVSHFSVWNADQVYDTIYVRGCIRYADNSLLRNTELLIAETRGNSYIGTSQAPIDVDGNFTVAMKKDAEAIVRISSSQSSTYYTSSVVKATDSDMSMPACIRIPKPETASQAPVVAESPQDKSIGLNTSTTLSVKLTNAGPFTYQWYQDGVAVTGATQATFTTPVLTNPEETHRYYVAITNNIATTESNVATVSVDASLLLPIINEQPIEKIVLVGEQATFSVVLDSAPLQATYQWLVDGAVIAGATAANYTTPALTLADSGKKYSVRVVNDAGTVLSNTALLTVNAPSNTADDATLRKIARFMMLDVLSGNLSGLFNQVVTRGFVYVDPRTNQQVVAQPSATYDPDKCSTSGSWSAKVDGIALQPFTPKSFSAGTNHTLSMSFSSPACVDEFGDGVSGDITSTFSYSGANTILDYNYTHEFLLSNASGSSVDDPIGSGFVGNGTWQLTEKSLTDYPAGFSRMEKTIKPKALAALSDQESGLTARFQADAGIVKDLIEIAFEFDGTNTTFSSGTITIEYLSPTSFTVNGVTYTASGKWSASIDEFNNVTSSSGSLLLKRNGVTVAEVYPSGSNMLVKVGGVASSL